MGDSSYQASPREGESMEETLRNSCKVYCKHVSKIEECNEEEWVEVTNITYKQMFKLSFKLNKEKEILERSIVEF